MPVTLNKAGDSNARSLIAAGKIDEDTGWSFSASDGDKLLGDDGDDWAEYAKWHLGEDKSADKETKARFKYPFGKAGKIYRRALVAIRSRASQQDAKKVFDAAGELINMIGKNRSDAGRSQASLFGGGLSIATRFADALPKSYDKKARTVDAVLSMGSPVKRFYGTEVLRIDPSSVLLDRLVSGGVPLLDSHNQYGISGALGRVQTAWFERGALLGRLAFNDTEGGRNAEGMVSRGEIAGVSSGYRVEEWEITDAEGNVIDPDRDRIRYDDDLTFTATRWELLEASLVTIPADAAAIIRVGGVGGDRPLDELARQANAAIARMQMRQAMAMRHLSLNASLRRLAR